VTEEVLNLAHAILFSVSTIIAIQNNMYNEKLIIITFAFKYSNVYILTAVLSSVILIPLAL